MKWCAPSLRDSGSLSAPRAIATVRKPEFVRELHAEMAEAADAEDRDHVARHRPAVAERVEGRDPGAEQRCGFGGAKLVGDRGERIGRDHHRLGIAAVVRDAGYAQVAAVDQPAAPARLAMAAMPAEPANADALSDAPALHAVAECVDHAGDLVPGDAREDEAGHLPFDGETVAVAYAAGLDADADLAARRLGHIALDEFKRTAGPRHLHRPHLCHLVLLVCEPSQKLRRLGG